MYTEQEGTMQYLCLEGKGEGGWKIRGGMIKKLRNEERVTKINRHRSWEGGDYVFLLAI